jgi:hypothetical protein
LEVLWREDLGKKATFLIDSSCTFEYLAMKITEQMENFEQFNNLKALRAVNICKNCELRGYVEINNSNIREILQNGDKLYFDLNSEEIWTKNVLHIKSFQNEIKIGIDLNIYNTISLRDYLLMLVKTCLYYWETFISDSSLNNDLNEREPQLKKKNSGESELSKQIMKKQKLHFLINEGIVSIKCTGKNCGEESKKIDFSQFQFYNLYGNTNKEEHIGQILGYSSQTEITLNLKCVEEHLFEEIKSENSMYEDKSEELFYKWNEFKEIQNYRQFVESTRFEEEFFTIKKMTKKYCN